MKSLNRLKGKDIITITIFSMLIYIVTMLIGMPMMFANFYLSMLASIGASCIINMGIYMLMAAKVKKPGVLFLHALIVGIIGTAMSTPLMFFIAIIPGLIAELIVTLSKKNDSLKMNAIAYTIFNCSYSLHGTIIVLYMGKEQFARMGASMFTDEQLDLILSMSFNVWVLVATVAITALGCLIGYFIGRKILKKNFEKAGVI